MEYRNKIFSELFSAETRIGLLPVGQFSKVKLQLNNKKIECETIWPSNI